MGVIGKAVGDSVICFLWMFCTACLGVGTFLVSSFLGIEGSATIAVTLGLLTVLIFVFSLLGEALGGVTWNPTMLAANYALGVGKNSLISMAVRFPAQAAGAVGGVLAISEVMPAQYNEFLKGPSLNVDVHNGAVAEGVLTLLLTYSVLLVAVRGPANSFFKAFLISIATLIIVVFGSTYTGPSMNPINAYSWAFLSNDHNKWEHFYVYWLAPFAGSIVAAVMFRLTAMPAQPAQEKKEKKA